MKVSDDLVRPQLDAALAAGQDLDRILALFSGTDFGLDGGGGDVVSPFSVLASTHILTRASTRKHPPFTTLGLRRTQVESPVQLSTFPDSLPANACQMFFERLNVAGFSTLERPTGLLTTSDMTSSLPCYSDDMSPRTWKNARMRYAALLGSSIIAKAGPSANQLSQSFSDDGCASLFFFGGNPPRIPEQKQGTGRAVRRRPSEWMLRLHD